MRRKVQVGQSADCQCPRLEWTRAMVGADCACCSPRKPKSQKDGGIMGLRFDGRLKQWNAERGFGFIEASDGGAQLFVHISAFRQRELAPVVGEALSFEVEPDRQGRKRAVRVLRQGESSKPIGVSRHSKNGSIARTVRSTDERAEGGGFFSALITMCVVLALGWFVYSQYMNRAARHDAILPAPAAALSSYKEPAPSNFRCDGRTMCSQMTSCSEAKLFLQNCPGMKMDGNGDGIPCEQQWCTGAQ